MKRTRFSLFYLAGYLFPSGTALLVVPRFSLKLLFSDHDHGDVMPRRVGVLFIVVGIIVVQIIRYPT